MPPFSPKRIKFTRQICQWSMFTKLLRNRAFKRLNKHTKTFLSSAEALSLPLSFTKTNMADDDDDVCVCGLDGVKIDWHTEDLSDCKIVNKSAEWKEIWRKILTCLLSDLNRISFALSREVQAQVCFIILFQVGFKRTLCNFHK